VEKPISDFALCLRDMRSRFCDVASTITFALTIIWPNKPSPHEKMNSAPFFENGGAALSGFAGPQLAQTPDHWRIFGVAGRAGFGRGHLSGTL